MEYCGELVGVASFKQHKGYVELKRLCFKHGVQVLGGLSKFISAYFKSAKSGVLSKYTSQLSAQNEIDEYIETKMPHRFDDGHGYDRVYRVGSKIWQFSRQK